MAIPPEHPSLRDHVKNRRLIRAMAVHSPLGAVLAEEAGFEAVWASGFELSALYGLADVSLVSMGEHLAMVRAIAQRCTLPIVADVDTGFGNAVNVVHTVASYERAGAAAIVMEDKTFPKVTSLHQGARQELARIEEFVGKIEAALYARRTRELVIIARTEALIAGAGLGEALNRGRAYADAGADMVLVHSKQKDPGEVEAFIAAWDRPTPIVVIPTSYPQMTDARAASLEKVAMVIYGNHGIRACVRAMRETFGAIAATGGALSTQDSIATVAEVFTLQEMPRIDDEERRFLR